MAEEDTLAALAAQVDDMRSTVARLNAIVTQWNARLEREGIGATLVLRAEVKRLAEQLAAAIDKNRAGPPDAPWWLGLPPEEYAARLAGLREWVERVARVQYPAYMERLPACWANHPDAIWELSTLMTEWARVYGDEDNRDLVGALWWHERWLPGALARLGQAIKCDVAGCRLTRSSPWGRPPPRPS